jgi:antitoxin ParD1/3/4
MQIALPPELEDLIKRQLASGKYQTAIEVLLAGAKLLEQQEDIYHGRLKNYNRKPELGGKQPSRVNLSMAPLQWLKFAPTCTLAMLPSHDPTFSYHRTCYSG